MAKKIAGSTNDRIITPTVVDSVRRNISSIKLKFATLYTSIKRKAIVTIGSSLFVCKCTTKSDVLKTIIFYAPTKSVVIVTKATVVSVKTIIVRCVERKIIEALADFDTL